MSRIFQQLGQAYGSSDVSVTVQLDGNTVFSGSVPAVDQPVSSPTPGADLTSEVFRWTDANEGTGNRTISITATGGTLRLGKTLAQIDSAQPDVFDFCHAILTEGENADPLRDVTIDGVSKPRLDDPSLTGQWWWDIESGSTLAATLNVNIALGNSDHGNVP